jgi:hypothetical protein
MGYGEMTEEQLREYEERWYKEEKEYFEFWNGGNND